MLPFVPRKVAQKAKTNIPTPKILYATSSGAARTPPVTQSSASSAKGKSKHTEPSIPDEDLATLLLLSLSDYSLWLNTDLRRALATADDGWLPLSDIAHHSSHLSHPNLKSVPESAYVKAVRTCAPELLEVRMRVSAPSRAGWYGEGSSASQDDSGGYEIRRKDWRDALLRARNHTRQEWELRTVYMECLPLAHRTVAGVCHFASSLLDLSEGDQVLDTRIQAVSFPAHHNDRPGDIPKPKGFALVIFSNESDAALITEHWPWLPRRTSAPAQPTNAATEDERADDAPRAALAREAVKFGFRALPKARWDALKEEYTAYRQRLLDEIAQASTETNDPQPTQHRPRHHHHIPAANAPETEQELEQDAPSPELTHQEPDTSAPAPLRPDAPFPPGCLVYLRGVHPETNKTTLKALLAAHGAALDYVDYNKGMSACHLRLSAPHHARTLVAALTDRPLAQRTGLDSTGAPPDASTDTKAIMAELVGGTREELYWSKVPEKVRREAVRKALVQSAVGRGGGGGEEPAEGEGREGAEGEGGHRKRKRRRKA